MRVVGIIQARTGSTRLPRKVLLPVGGRPALERMIERVRASAELDEVVIATTQLPADEPIRALAAAVGVPCTSGHPTDLLDRHLQAAREASADVVVKIPSDCPLIDPRVIDEVVSFFRRHRGRFDYVSNLHPASWPDGNDVEVMSVVALVQAWKQATRDFEREHTTPFIWDQPERFRVGNVTASTWTDRPDLANTHRLTLDYAEDHQVIAAVFEALQRPTGGPFTVEQIVTFLDEHPEIRAINQCHGGTSWMTKHASQLKTVHLGTLKGFPARSDAQVP